MSASRNRRRAGTVVAAALLGIVTIAASAPAGAINSDPEYTGNSTTTTTAATPKPDLAVGVDGTITQEYPQTTWTVTYTVTNRGTASSPATQAGVGPLGTASISWYRSIPALARGASFTDRFTISRNGCWHALRVTVDPNGSTSELSESNNAYAVTGGHFNCAGAPMYQVKLTTLRALDETNDDWKGSDEPYVIWAGSLPNSTGEGYDARHSREFSDVDTEESRTFPADDGCVWAPCGGARRAFHGICFNLSLWESDLDEEAVVEGVLRSESPGGSCDLSYVSSSHPEYAATLARADEEAEDQLIGHSTNGFTRNNLAWLLPTLQSTHTATKRLAGYGAYNLTFTITRAN